VNEILSVGLILMAALIAGHAAQLVRVPEVTGYILVGLAIGPAAFDLISHENLVTLGFLSEVAVGLILFNIGSIFEAARFRALGTSVVRLELLEASLAFLLVGLGLVAIGMPWPIALLLGVIAMETAPATTLMVLNEYDASGPLTDRLRALIALNGVFVLFSFGVVAALLTLVGPSPDPWWLIGYRAAYQLAWTTAGSVALGIVLGLVVDAWAARAKESGEAMILVIGIVLVAVGAARGLELSPLLATLALGATVANASIHGERLVGVLGRVDPPLYAAFFVLAGAELDPGDLRSIGVAGIVYVIGRVVGKVGGARLALRGADVPQVVREQMGYCLISSSSLAVGLTIQVRHAFPELAPTVTGIVLAAIVIFEVIGPLATRRALVVTGEAKTLPAPLREAEAAEF
jgi:Kef-type K+ transport system membrane component KefB